jgi:hypothetical protein
VNKIQSAIYRINNPGRVIGQNGRAARFFAYKSGEIQYIYLYVTVKVDSQLELTIPS